MPSIQLDLSKLYGFKILATGRKQAGTPRIGEKIGEKVGQKSDAKIPGKLGSKAGIKTDRPA